MPTDSIWGLKYVVPGLIIHVRTVFVASLPQIIVNPDLAVSIYRGWSNNFFHAPKLTSISNRKDKIFCTCMVQKKSELFIFAAHNIKKDYYERSESGAEPSPKRVETRRK
jgi:hypothetical protein